MSEIAPWLLLAAAALAAPLGAGDAPTPAVDLDANLILAPEDPAEWPALRGRLERWRAEARERLRYDDALYRRPEFAWVPSCFSCSFLMMCDESILDREEGAYTVETFLDREEKEFGGYDAVVLWHAYPRIGLDDRNQFDFYRDLPGGLAGLRDVSGRFHARGVKVFVDYNPWDIGTRREGKGDMDLLVELVAAIDADGIFLDTMDRGAEELRSKLDAARPGVVLEGEGALPLERVHDHHMSWAQWFRDGRIPGILRNKWLERRHIQHQIHRWSPDHSGELHSAWMNGSGMMVWENVFGSWVGWSARDRSILRAMLPVQRRFRETLSGEGWTPLVPTEAEEVYASLWEGAGGVRLWTLVNRSEKPVEGALLRVPSPPPGHRTYDLLRGREVTTGSAGDGSTIAIQGRIPPRGVGAFASGTSQALGAGFAEFLASQERTDARAETSTEFPTRVAKLRPVEPTERCPPGVLPAGMVLVPGATLRMKTVFRIRECGFYDPQEHHLARGGIEGLHRERAIERDVTIASFAIDATPVTNAQFAEFLRRSGYRPRHPESFLRHYKGEGRPPEGLGDHPVVFVDLDDARAYARWAGKRLPTEEEWQYAAQGADGRRWPWGEEFREDLCNGGGRSTTPVGAYPGGKSPFGCLDVSGNTWEWTESERSDGRTRFAILKGGSYYRARGSDWYFDGGPRPCDFAAKVLLTWPGLDRSATVGFRCVVDVGEGRAATSANAAATTFDVREFGAKGDRTTNDRGAIQRAVDACALAGGGTVRVPPGDYLSGTIRLGEGVRLHLEKGATIWASTDPRDYDLERKLLFADGVRGIGVVGEGTIHGQATGDFGKRWGAPETADFRTGILLFQNCKDVTIRGIRILYSDSWTVHLKRCESVLVEDVVIRNNYRRLNSDGIDPNSCRHVRIRRCDIVAGDDAIVLKSTESVPCEDVEVTGCTLESATAAIKLGTESRGDFRDIVFRDCTIRNSPVGVGFYLKDGAVMERVTATDLRMEICDPIAHQVAPIFMDIERRHEDSPAGKIRDVTFRGIDIATGSGILIQGMPESPIEDLTLDDITVRIEHADDYAGRKKPVGGKRTTRDERDTCFARLPSYATVAHVRGLSVSGLEVRIAEEAFRGCERSALALRHVSGATVRRVRREPGPAAGSMPAIDAKDCADVRMAVPEGGSRP